MFLVKVFTEGKKVVGKAFFPKERRGHESKDTKEEIASSDTEAERNLERITSMDGGKVKYRVKSFDEAEKTLSVIGEITWSEIKK